MEDMGEITKNHYVAVAYKVHDDRVTRWHNENDIDDGIRDYPKDLIWDISIDERRENLIKYLFKQDNVGIIKQVFAVYVEDNKITGFKGNVLLQPEMDSLAKLRDSYHYRMFNFFMQKKNEEYKGDYVLRTLDEYDYQPKWL